MRRGGERDEEERGKRRGGERDEEERSSLAHDAASFLEG